MRSLILAVSMLTFALTASSQSINDLLKQGNDFYSESRFDDAVMVSEQVLKKDSNNYAAYVLRGRAYIELKEPGLAVEDFTKAILLKPDSAEAYHCRAHVFLSHMYSEEAIYDNTMAIKLTKNDTVKMISYINRGAARTQIRDFQGAYEDYSNALLYDTNNLGAINNIATVLDELGRRDEAMQYLFRAMRMDSTFMGAYVNIGFQYTKMGRHKEAIEYFDKALKLDPNDGLTYNNKGFALYSLKEYDRALTNINKSIELYPGNSYAFKNRALVYLATNQKEKACADLRKAIEMNFTTMYGDEVENLLKANCK